MAKILVPIYVPVNQINSQWLHRPESDPAGGVFGNTFGSLTYSVFKYKHQNFYLVQTSFSEFVQ